MNVSPMITGALMPLPMANEIHHPVFDDIYFNPDDGIGESRYVFLSGIGVPDVWQGMGSYHITELGFGTGLNFCLTLGEWLRTAKPNEHLTYTGIDMYPLDIETLRRAGAAWPELKAEYEMLTSVYPGTAAGMTVVYPAPNVTLMLLWGEVMEMLGAMRRRQNAWYLDGFAPQKNPQMWRDEIYAEMKRLSVPGARVATFTAAGMVKRGLTNNGFQVIKTKGFAQKRERITASYGTA